MRRFNPGNFYCGTTAEWTSCPRPVRHPDHMSGSGSDYWYGESGVVRYSDHWGSEVASCDWYLDGVARCSFDDHDGWRCGFAPWTEFELKTFEVTVYHPDLLPSESARRARRSRALGRCPGMAAWHGRYTVRVVSSPAGHDSRRMRRGRRHVWGLRDAVRRAVPHVRGRLRLDRGRTGRLDGGLPRGSGLPVTPGHVRR